MGFRDLFRRTKKPSASEASARPEKGGSLTELEQQLVELLLQYGLTSDERLIAEIQPVYARAIVELPAEKRMQMFLYLIETVEQKKVGGNALMPFIFQETGWQIISTAALHAACVWHGSDEDLMLGVRELVGWGRKFAQDGDENRASAIFAGLALLGDRRVLECLGPCWRHLSSDGRSKLSTGLAGRTYAGLVDWLIGWLEECEGGEFGAVAAALARIPTYTQPPEVVEVRRAIPIWSADEDHAITIVSRWSFEGYGERIRPRLLQIAADEQSPRVMYDVLKAWHISHSARQVAGVAMRPRATTAPPRDLLPLLGDAVPVTTRLVGQFIPLEDEDFVDRDGQLVCCWAIFNPWGPTWSCLGLLPTEDPTAQLLFYRMLNPFQQRSGILGVLRGADGGDLTVIGSLVESAFGQDAIAVRDDEELYLIASSLPDLVQVAVEHPIIERAVQRAFFANPRVRDLDVVRAVRLLREFQGRPWDRATAQMQEGLKDLPLDGPAIAEVDQGVTTDVALEEWWQIVNHVDSWLPELFNFPGAWHGAIDNTVPALAQTAYTFWQLDDFLARYGYPRFRDIAEMLAKRERGAEPGTPGQAEWNEQQVSGTSPDELRDYAAASARLRQRWESLDPDSATPLQLADAAVAQCVAVQMAIVQEQLDEPARAIEVLPRHMRKPWPLGYMLGTAFAAIERFEVPRESYDTESVIVRAHQYGIPGISTADVSSLSSGAREKPGFEEGMMTGGRDAIAMLNHGTSPVGLSHWLREEMGR